MNEFIIKLVADGVVIPVVLIATWALLFRIEGNRFQAYFRILLAGLKAYLAAKLIGSVFQPETLRPFQQLGLEAGASFLNNPGFPSDHVLFCTAITLAVWFETRQKKITGILLTLTLLVAVGRVAALVHTSLDVLGGLLIACAGIPWYLQRDHDPSIKTIPSASRKKHKKRVK